MRACHPMTNFNTFLQGRASPMAVENTKNAIVLRRQNQVSIFHTGSPAIPRSGVLGCSGGIRNIQNWQNPKREVPNASNGNCINFYVKKTPENFVWFTGWQMWGVCKNRSNMTKLIAAGSHLCHGHIELLLMRETEMIRTQSWVNIWLYPIINGYIMFSCLFI